MITSYPLYNQLTRYCLTVEDIVGHPVEMNNVVYNFALEPTRRLEIFTKAIKPYTSHIFTNDELLSLLPFKPFNSKDLVKMIRKYMEKTPEQSV